MFKTVFLSTLASAAAVISAHATIYDFGLAGRATSDLSGGNEVPANASPATGKELGSGITYDDSTHQLSLHVGWGSDPAVGGSDLTADFTSAVIQGPSNPNGTTSGGLLYNVTSGEQNGNTGGRSGFLDLPQSGNTPPALQLVDNPNGSGWTVSDQEAQLLAGQWYLNITSTDFPGGEIRGQLTPVPEPEQYAMVAGLALLGFAGYRRYKMALCV